jgi:transposase
VGVDVSKDFSTAQGLDKNGKKLFYLRFAMNSGGFSELLKLMVKHAESVTGVTVAMESTGCYHINFFSFLSSEGIACVVVNPLLIANFTRLSLRKTKTDKKRIDSD